MSAPVSIRPQWKSYIGKRLGQGAFSEVYAVKRNPGLVAKVWKKRTDWVDDWEDDCLIADVQAKIFHEIGSHVPKIVGKFLLKDPSGVDRLAVFMKHAGAALRDNGEVKNLSLQEIYDVAAKILEGLVKLHRAGFVHLDIKNSNLTERGMILDWDFCKRVREDLITGCGTLEYKSPESFFRRPISAKTDMWSLGVTLHAQLTLHIGLHGLLWGRCDERELERQIASELRVLEKDPEKAKFFNQVIAPMLRFDPKKRVSAEEARVLLQQFLDEQSANKRTCPRKRRLS